MIRNTNRTKIVTTIGPATSSVNMLTRIIKAGADIMRLNFSHGSHDVHQEVIQNIRKVKEKLNSQVGILLDLQGPKLRIGEVENNRIELKRGKNIILTTTETVGTAEKISINFKTLPQDVKKGERILLDDGKIELKVIETLNETEILAKVVYGGPLSSKKGFNLPYTKLSIPSMTEKDHEDLEFGLKNGVEWVGLSFVRTADDIIYLKKLIKQANSRARVVAKIEKPEAVKNIDSIIEVSDGIMVARGDLGVEMPMAEVPIHQKMIVQKCIIASKPVIIATQMMESMIKNPTPTRAEVNDVANAVLDGADAVMLSAETSVGDYPVEVVQAMQETIVQAETLKSAYYKGKRPESSSKSFLSDEICFTAVRMSDHLKAKAIVSMTRSGYTAFKIASFRPEASIFIFTDDADLLSTLSLVWGVRGFFYNMFESTDQTIKDVISFLAENKLVKTGDIVINTASMPIHEQAKTNTIKVSVVK